MTKREPDGWVVVDSEARSGSFRFDSAWRHEANAEYALHDAGPSARIRPFYFADEEEK